MKHPKFFARTPLLRGLSALTIAASTLVSAPSRAEGKADAEPLLPAAARLWVIAPSATGTWTMRIDNLGDAPLRIPADVRLLKLSLEGRSEGKYKRAKKATCSAPGALRPDGFPETRALILAPGESYVETFDPHLLCFGKDADLLVGGTTVRASFGWDPPPKWSRKAPEAPFAAEATNLPATYAPLRGLNAPTMLLSFASPSEAAGEPSVAEASPPGEAPPSEHPAPAPVVDATAPRLGLESQAMSDASAPRRITVTVKATNVGHRPMMAALRTRMLSFSIDGPEGRARCDEAPPTNAIPRDNYRTFKPGASTSFTVLLGEACPPGVFMRAGLYRVTPALHASASGKDVGVEAFMADVSADQPTLVRLQSAEEPYYKAPPHAVKTADLGPKEDEE